MSAIESDPWKRLNQFGCPYHGEVKQRGSAFNEILLPNGEKKRAYSTGPVYYVKHPNAPGATRTTAQQAEDARLGWQWLDYGLVSQGTKIDGTPGTRFSGCVWFPADHYLYCDEHRAWLIRTDFVANETYPAYTDKVELWLVGVFGGVTCERKLTTITLNYWMEINSTPLTDRIAIAPSPDGRNWFVNTYETASTSPLTYSAANCITSTFLYGGTQQVARVLREVWKVAIVGNGATTGTIGNGITATATLYKTDSETFTSSLVETELFPGHCEECAETPFSYPVGSCDECVSTSDSDSSEGSYSSTAMLGFWYDKDGVEQTGTIVYEQTSSWETSSSVTKSCSDNVCTVTAITCSASQSATMTRTITLPGHSESQTDDYLAESDCSGVVTITGTPNGRWGSIETVDGAAFGEYCLDGWAGVLTGGVPGTWFSTRSSTSSDQVTVDMYGNKTTNAKTSGPIYMHPLTGNGDEDTLGWV